MDVQIPDTYMNISDMNRTLTGLNPYTQYALYIKTYTIATVKDGGQSPIQYFRTDADRKFYFNIILLYFYCYTEYFPLCFIYFVVAYQNRFK